MPDCGAPTRIDLEAQGCDELSSEVVVHFAVVADSSGEVGESVSVGAVVANVLVAATIGGLIALLALAWGGPKLDDSIRSR
jgi:hypothetical protein